MKDRSNCNSDESKYFNDVNAVLTMRQAHRLAKELGRPVSRHTMGKALQCWLKGDKSTGLNGFRLGRMWLIHKNSFLAWIKAHVPQRPV